MVLFYLVFYFFPSLKTINRLKREVKLAQEIAQEGMNNIQNFETFTKAEWRFIKSQEKIFLQKFPVITNQADLIALSSNLTNYFKKLAGKDQIKNLILLSNINGLKVNIDPLYSDRETLEDLITFTKIKNKEILIKNNENINKIKQVQKKNMRTPFGILAYGEIAVGISSDFIKCLNFINHLPWGEFQINVDHIEIEDGRVFPKVLILLKIFYFDKKVTKTPQLTPLSLIYHPAEIDPQKLLLPIDTEVKRYLKQELQGGSKTIFSKKQN